MAQHRRVETSADPLRLIDASSFNVDSTLWRRGLGGSVMPAARLIGRLFGADRFWHGRVVWLKFAEVALDGAGAEMPVAVLLLAWRIGAFSNLPLASNYSLGRDEFSGSFGWEPQAG